VWLGSLRSARQHADRWHTGAGLQPYGCPKPNTMGHCFVETLDGKFIGLVSTASLTKEAV
jgi:hypothetical protein